MQIVILAAGQGKRMRSALPKVLQPLSDRPLLGHVLRTAAFLSPSHTCIVFGHGGDAVRAAFPDAGVAWALQADQLGTGHAVMQALPVLSRDEPVMVLYGDVPLLRAETLARLAEAAGDDKLGILTVTLDDPSGYGRIVRDAAGRIVRIVEQKDASDGERRIREVNTGIMVVPGARLAGWLTHLSNDNAQREYYLTDVVAAAVRDGVPVVSTQPERVSETLGVNDKAQLAELERIHQRENAERLLADGVTLRDPARIDVRGELICGRDVEIDIGCIFEGRVELGDGVCVGAHSVLRNVTVAAGTRIAPFCHFDSAEVGASCQLGPYARLRPGSVLADDVHIGNFVEVKNSSIAAHSKANHLAYVGDATVGSRVNIGAGTICCNYDGANKFRTVIEDDVFIGSDTQLVAPVTVGRGATLGAGTTLTENAPPDALTISRARQITIAGWKRPVKKK
ncbi:MAG: bifunctional UDP-N-acetylglucosamine diphosphorylase/glucosamine-1-phosphate N-acetyltransferase GlmU [Methyloversatilis sp.]|jgi:bifunctional UDP-N-acetylglucosamine pyrophosphorylase/glucosamine-1-phosphate N-acetyltransferase|nr:bifunctional UDP-N-acetylglucosamine diphosphorylase/glucosamine-1-phosphate N-acetyltransferase GlmU [Methyloversatilis sp.]MBP6193560.1 bifunctional UDP-N-acetylglucosamine diphosphorylase/glucosamine-1-phosphate N-acetyltransferase GlmU [Methyloversatilis sp.]MBP9118449.1 bifunctional UDP-N-acetylglucosamine diphosphorylase/glucosamine-1-phosphate N-acetyltransferase GlmU [Methyloversatilis sp.]